MTSSSSYLNYLTSLLIDPQVLRGPLQPAAVLIQAGRNDEAHHLLLKLSRKVVRDPNLWLMLAWTAPTLNAALEYYRFCAKLDPSNELAKAGLTSTRQALDDFDDPSVGSILPPKPLEVLVSYKPPSTTPAISHRYTSLTQGVTRLSEIHFVWIMVAYLLLIAIAELITTFSNPQLGLGLHGLIMVILFFQASTSRVRTQRRYLFTVSLAPLIRILSLSMPLVGFQSSYWYAIIGVPLLLAAFLVYRLTGYRPSDVGLCFRKLPLQLPIGFLGFLLGWIEYRILRPAPLVQSLRPIDIWITALILLIFTGFLEEFIFRGLMQRAAENIMGRYGPYWISLLFAVLHVGYRSYLDFGFVMLVGLIFAFIVKWTKSIYGVTLAHGLTNITLYILVPMLLK